MTDKNALFAEYLFEKMGIETIITDDGFVSYSMKQESLHIHEMYVSKESRRKGKGTDLLIQMQDLAREKGYSAITANCQLDQAATEQSLRAILDSGFKVINEPKQISFYMEVN